MAVVTMFIGEQPGMLACCQVMEVSMLDEKVAYWPVATDVYEDRPSGLIVLIIGIVRDVEGVTILRVEMIDTSSESMSR